MDDPGGEDTCLCITWLPLPFPFGVAHRPNSMELDEYCEYWDICEVGRVPVPLLTSKDFRETIEAYFRTCMGVSADKPKYVFWALRIRMQSGHCRA